MKAAAPVTWRKKRGEPEYVFFYLESTRKEEHVRRRERCVPPSDEDSEFPSYDTLNRGLSYLTGSGVWLLLIKDGLTLTSQMFQLKSEGLVS